MLTKKKQAKPGRGRPATGSGDVIGLRLQPELEKALEQWMLDQKELSLTKQEAIRRLLRALLAEQGYLKGADKSSG
jgi:hypothetical protein